jgi:hypothetical protein
VVTAAAPARRDPVLALAAGFAIAWAIARAWRQSVTVDEADSYLMFAARGWAAALEPGSANHVLNTLLTRLSTSFGLSHLTLRAPALLGAGLYVTASCLLCVAVGRRRAVRWPLFVCLVYNPFVMDYMVVARGYGLALGLLMAAIWAMAGSRFALASVCAGLSFCANFSFAYVDASLLIVCCFRAWERGRSWREAATCVLLASATVLTLCGWTLYRWPRGELFYGATSLGQMWTSIASATFDEWNVRLPYPAIAAVTDALRPALAWWLAGVAAWQAARASWQRHPLGLALSFVAMATLVAHGLQWRLAGIPLPFARTGLFFVLLVGIGAGLATTSRLGALARWASVAALCLSAIYFLGCLRLSYFKEWRFGAEGREAFLALVDARRERPFRAVGADWRYSDAMSFYRVCLHHPEVGPILDGRTPGLPAYVLFLPEAEAFLRQEGLEVVYRGPLSDVAVAVRRARDE